MGGLVLERKKTYKLTKDKAFFREEMEFKNILHELYWKFTMKKKGFKVEEINRN